MSASFLVGGAGVLVAAVLAVFLMRDGRAAGASDQGAADQRAADQGAADQRAADQGAADEGVLGEVVSAGSAEVSR
jgi:hypothetical protein